MALRLTPREVNAGQELAEASLADLITQMAEAVAEGQAKLDLSSAQVAAELARTKVEFIPAIRQIIEEDGSMRFEQADPIEVSLLDLGLQPTFYSFSEATVEVSMDLKVVEETTTTGGAKLTASTLFASTRSLRTERKLNRDVSISSRMSAKLVPVPMPAILSPVRELEDRREGGGV